MRRPIEELRRPAPPEGSFRKHKLRLRLGRMLDLLGEDSITIGSIEVKRGVVESTESFNTWLENLTEGTEAVVGLHDLISKTTRGNIETLLPTLRGRESVVAEKGTSKKGEKESVVYSRAEILGSWGSWRKGIRERVRKGLSIHSS